MKKETIIVIVLAIALVFAYNKGASLTKDYYEIKLEAAKNRCLAELEARKIKYQNELEILREDIEFNSQALIDKDLELESYKNKKLSESNEEYKRVLKKINTLSEVKDETEVNEYVNEKIPPVILNGLRNIKREGFK